MADSLKKKLFDRKLKQCARLESQGARCKWDDIERRHKCSKCSEPRDDDFCEVCAALEKITIIVDGDAK